MKKRISTSLKIPRTSPAETKHTTTDQTLSTILHRQNFRANPKGVLHIPGPNTTKAFSVAVSDFDLQLALPSIGNLILPLYSGVSIRMGTTVHHSCHHGSGRYIIAHVRIGEGTTPSSKQTLGNGNASGPLVTTYRCLP